jgi:hypothetical protein
VSGEDYSLDCKEGQVKKNRSLSECMCVLRVVTEPHDTSCASDRAPRCALDLENPDVEDYLLSHLGIHLLNQMIDLTLSIDTC